MARIFAKNGKGGAEPSPREYTGFSSSSSAKLRGDNFNEDAGYAFADKIDRPVRKVESRESPISVLHLQQSVLLHDGSRWLCYQIVHGIARILPAAVIYGGTAGLLVCAICSYRWGVLLALTLYTFYMFLLCCAFMVFAVVGLIRVWLNGQERWYAKYCTERDKMDQRAEEREILGAEDGDCGDIGWNDVIHVVMVPSYKTPNEVLEETLASMEKFSLAKTNLLVCLAFEEREDGVTKKAAAFREKFADRFRSVFTSFHPANLQGEIPGKSSNECWAFKELCSKLESEGISSFDPRIVITVVDDDSELHENYFEALTYHFLMTPQRSRYITTWQPPICHFKNYLRQPVIVRISSLFATLNELACLANPVDCHVNYSSYSLSLVLASSVGGWDPDYLAEDWHMFAKCSLMTSGRVRCQPIFLPLLNYTPEEDTYCGTLFSRWVQAKRHALGVSELVYVISTLYLGVLEVKTWRSRITYLWRLAPLLGKFAQVHFTNGMSAILNLLAQVVIHFYMWRSWCYVSFSSEDNGTCRLAMASATQHGIAEEQIVLNSWMVYWQQRITAAMAAVSIFSGGFGAVYFHLVADRVEGNVSEHQRFRNPVLHWISVELEVSTIGMMCSLVYGAFPLWIAVIRVVREAKFNHVVAGMVGRADPLGDDAEVIE